MRRDAELADANAFDETPTRATNETKTVARRIGPHLILSGIARSRALGRPSTRRPSIQGAAAGKKGSQREAPRTRAQRTHKPNARFPRVARRALDASRPRRAPPVSPPRCDRWTRAAF